MATKFYTTLPSYLLGIFFILAFVNVKAQGSEMEPNNTRAQANIIPLNGNISAALMPAGDVDWFQVTTTGDGQLNITFDNTGNADLKVITLFDNDGVTQINTLNVANGAAVLNSNGLAAGTYYIKINGNLGTETGAYKLSDTLIVPARTNDVEPNNNFSQADMLPLNDSVTGHVGYYYNNMRDTSDWYKLNLIARGVLKILLDNSGNSDTKSLNLYDASGTNLVTRVGVGNGRGGFKTDTLSTGIYYIQIIGASANDFGAYSLMDTLYTALPVTFLNFDGKISGTAALLSWSTATEDNNKGFDIERSEDGQRFMSIGFVAGVGTSSVINNYTFSDVKVASGSNYYRLRQEDIDNNYSYSSIIRLNYSKFNWFISGSPITSNSWIQLQLDKETNVAIRILSANGDVISTVNKGRLSAGNYSVPLNFNTKSNGVYIVQLITDNATYAKTIVK